MVKLALGAQGLSLLDYFTPYNYAALNSGDLDIGSGGVMIPPDQPSGSPYVHLMVAVSKDGTLYLINRDQLGEFSASGNNIVQTMTHTFGHIFSTAAWWNGTLYQGSNQSALQAFPLSTTTGQFPATPSSVTPTPFGRGPTPSISANGSMEGILWALDNSAYVAGGTSGATVLHAYRADNLGTEIYNSTQNTTRDAAGPAVKFTVPTVADGQVYVGGQGQFTVYGLLPGFGLSAQPASATLQPGSTARFNIQAATSSTFSGNVTYSVSGLPAGVTAGFSPATTAVPGSTTLTVTVPPSTTLGNYSVSIIGTSGTATSHTTLPLSITSLPGEVAINAGGPTVGVFQADMNFNGGSGPASTTAAIDTSGVTNPAPPAVYQDQRWGVFSYTIPNLTAGGNYNVRLHFAETSYFQSGKRLFNVLINGAQVLTNFDVFATAGAANKAVIEQFNTSSSPSGQIVIQFQQGTADYPMICGIDVVPLGTFTPGFSLSASPNSQSVPQGTATSYTFTVTPQNGFNSSVTFSVSGLPSGATASFNPASVTGSGNTTLAVSTAAATPAGTYSLLVTGASGSLTQTVTVTLVVTSTSEIAINAGGGIVGIFQQDTDFNGGSGPASTTASINTSGVTNPAPQAVYQDERWGVFSYTIPNLTPGGSYQVRLHFAETSYFAAGMRKFNVVINGTQVLTNFDVFATAGGANTAVIEQFTAVATSSGQIVIQFQQGSVDQPMLSGLEIIPLDITTPDFTLNATPSSQTVPQGGAANYSLTVTPVNGFNSTVAFSLTGLPTGATASFAPTSVTGSGNATLAVSTAASTPAGTYSLVVTGTSGSLSHMVTVTLVVTSVGEVAINAGGPAVGVFQADKDFNGGNGPASTTAPINTTGVVNPAPPAVYQDQRWGAFSYTIPNFTAGANYTVRLHFAETNYYAAGKRQFNVLINGTPVLTNFDVYATSGAPNTAVVEQFTAKANTNGQVVIQFTQGAADQPMVCGIEVIPQ